MSSEVASTPATAAALPRLAACSVLAISRDPVERQALVLELGAQNDVEASSASGFHMAVPLIWSNPPAVIVVGALTRTDRQHLAELRRHAPKARVVLLASAGDVYGEAKPDARVPAGDDLVGALAALLPAAQE